jgi:hypothetical protein
MQSENEQYIVRKIQQNEVQDIFEVTNKETQEITYDKFPRSMEMTCDDVLEYYD